MIKQLGIAFKQLEKSKKG